MKHNMKHSKDNVFKTAVFKKTALATAATLFMSTATTAMAQQVRDIEVIPANDAQGLNLTLDIADGRDTVNIGDMVAFCFTASESGYISMWDIGTSGKISKIYPYRQHSAIRSVQANRRECVGDGRFRVTGPVGIENVVLYWTASEQGQLEADQYKNVKQLAESIQSHAKDIVQTGAGWDAWATTEASFRIVGQGESGGYIPPTSSQVRQTLSQYNNVFVVAVGSNVGDLKKTNDDARLFAQLAQSSFGVPSNNIRFIENAKRQDIQDALAWLAGNAQPNDLVFFYYSGHGAQIKDDNGDEADGLDEALVPYDLNDPNKTSNPAYYLRDDDLKAWLQDIRAGAVVTIFDACHSGGLYKSFSRAGVINARRKLFTKGAAAVKHDSFVNKSSSAMSRDISIIDNVDNMSGNMSGNISSNISGNSFNGNKTKYVMLAAAQEAQYALEMPGEGGVFTVALSDYLQSNTTMMNWTEMMDNLSRSIRRATEGQQEPKTTDPSGALNELSFHN